jgi:hypothetical protein
MLYEIDIDTVIIHESLHVGDNYIGYHFMCHFVVIRYYFLLGDNYALHIYIYIISFDI